MNSWAIYNINSGRIEAICYGTEAEAQDMASPGEAVLGLPEGGLDPYGYYIKDGVIHAYPPKPEEGYYWNSEKEKWEADLAALKAVKWEAMKAARDAAEFGEMEFLGHSFDIDEVSQRRLQGAVMLAQMGAFTEMEWTLADNSAVVLTAAQITQLGAALGAHINVLHLVARELRAAIDTAETVAEVQAIEWVNP